MTRPNDCSWHQHRKRGPRCVRISRRPARLGNGRRVRPLDPLWRQMLADIFDRRLDTPPRSLTRENHCEKPFRSI